MIKKVLIICSILVAILAGLAFYSQTQPKQRTYELTIPETNLNFVLKTKYIDNEIRTTVMVENGWLLPHVDKIARAYDYDDFIVLSLDDEDDTQICKIKFNINDFAQTSDAKSYIAKKNVEISKKKYVEIKKIQVQYPQVFRIKEYIK